MNFTIFGGFGHLQVFCFLFFFCFFFGGVGEAGGGGGGGSAGGGSLSKLTIQFFWVYQNSWYFLDTVRIGVRNFC